MQTSKNTILGIVIIVLFGASAVVLYNGFAGNSGDIISPSPDIAGNQKELVNVLPYGETLDFAKIKARSTGTKVVPYEAVNPAEVGIDQRTLIAPGFGVQGTTPSPTAQLGNPSPFRSN